MPAVAEVVLRGHGVRVRNPDLGPGVLLRANLRVANGRMGSASRMFGPTM